jgi:hypothetical protein
MVATRYAEPSEQGTANGYVDAMDYVAVPRRTHGRVARQEPLEDADTHELHDQLTPDEECDCNDARDGKMVMCACTQRIQQEEELERQAQLGS